MHGQTRTVERVDQQWVSFLRRRVFGHSLKLTAVIGPIMQPTSQAFTLRIFVPDGDPEGVRLIDRMNWTGLAIVFPRSEWQEVRKRQEFERTGIYILTGYREGDDDLTTVYIGQADGIRSRIDSHIKRKEFWDSGIVFVSSKELHRAHLTWLEYALVNRAVEAKRCHIDNGNVPQEPVMSEAEKADTHAFLQEVLQILPFVGLQAFEMPRAVAGLDVSGRRATDVEHKDLRNVIVVPAKAEGFKTVFLTQDCWHAVPIAGGMLDKIEYIAGYQTSPVSAITHYAPVSRIEPYGESGKYKLVFGEKAKPIQPIPFGNAPLGSMQGHRYTTFERLMQAKTLTDLFGS